MSHAEKKNQASAPLSIFVWTDGAQPLLPPEFTTLLPKCTTLHAYGPAIFETYLPCAVIWRDPANALAAALEADQPLGPLLARWQEVADGLLAIFRSNSHRMILLSEIALRSDDPQTRAEVTERLQLASPPAPISSHPKNDLPYLLAEFAVRQLDPLSTRLSELEAASIFCPRPVFGLAQLERASYQVRLMQQAMDTLKQERDKQQTELDELSLMADRAVSKVLSELRIVAEARLRAESDLRQTQAECERLRREAEQLEETRAHLDRMAGNLVEIYGSNSWKITAPLRQISLILRRASRLIAEYLRQ